MRRTPQPAKKEMKKTMKKNRIKGEVIIKKGIRDLFDRIFKS